MCERDLHPLARAPQEAHESEMLERRVDGAALRAARSEIQVHVGEFREPGELRGVEREIARP